MIGTASLVSTVPVAAAVADDDDDDDDDDVDDEFCNS